MTPFEASNNSLFPSNNINNNNKIPRSFARSFAKFQVGDFVRVPDKRNIYSKGYTTNWNRELFKIHSINSTNPLTDTLEDENRNYSRKIL